MNTKVRIVFYSMYGHVYQMAQAVAAGVGEVPDTEAVILQVPELIPEEKLIASGGQETTIQSFHTTLLHHGMIVVGVPYSEPRLLEMNEISGGTPYGATTLANHDGSRQPTENELAIAKFQGKHVAEVARKLFS